MPNSPQMAARPTAASTTEAPATPMTLASSPPTAAPAMPPAPPRRAQLAPVAGDPAARSARPAETTRRSTKAASTPVRPRLARPARRMTPPTASEAGTTSAPQPSARALSRRSRWPAGPSTLKWIPSPARTPTTRSVQPQASSEGLAMSSATRPRPRPKVVVLRRWERDRLFFLRAGGAAARSGLTVVFDPARAGTAGFALVGAPREGPD